MASKPGTRKAAGTPKSGMKERGSPLSPTRLSRLQEKEELQCLNDRLAAYIDRVRQLELENSRLTVQVETIQESVSKEVTTMKGLYEGELTEARRLVDDTAKERAQLQIDVGKLRTANEDLRIKLARKERDLNSVQRSLEAAEGQVTDLTARLNTTDAERKKLLLELRELKEEVARLGDKLAEAKKQLESEMLMRVDLENRCQSLREELQFKQQVYEQEVTELKKKKQVEISEIDGQLKVEYDSKLAESLRELRDDYQDQLRCNKEEIESLYETKMDELSRRDQRSAEDSQALTSTLRETKRQVQELNSKMAYLEGTNQTLEQRISDLEAQLEGERESHLAETRRLREEIQELISEKQRQTQEYTELMDVKVALDMEIAAYRKLLEAEEARLNLSASSLKTPSTPSSSSALQSASVRRTPLRTGLKRKRGMLAHEERTSRSFKSAASATGALEIVEDCPEGKFVKIFNRSEKDINLGGYQIIRETEQGDSVSYKFHSKSKIIGNTDVTVWSCNVANVTHDPPRSIVMKNQVWPVGGTIKTRLISASEEVAQRESKQEEETFYMEKELPEAKRVASATTTTASPEKCSVM